MNRDGLFLPAPGQTLLSGSGRAWEVMRVWETDYDFGADVRLTRDDGSTVSRTVFLNRTGSWKLRLEDRFSGEWNACPRCGARYGAVTTCPFDGARLLPLTFEEGES